MVIEEPEEVYILNTNTMVAHKRRGLTEQCNTDDILAAHKEFSIELPEGFTRCEHCFPEG